MIMISPSLWCVIKIVMQHVSGSYASESSAFCIVLYIFNLSLIHWLYYLYKTGKCTSWRLIAKIAASKRLAAVPDKTEHGEFFSFVPNSPV